MAKAINSYGDEVVYRLLITDILNRSLLSAMDIEIFVLRYGQDWYYEDIGVYIGKKYRGKPYTEGAMRYRTSLIKTTLREFLSTLDQLDSTLR